MSVCHTNTCEKRQLEDNINNDNSTSASKKQKADSVPVRFFEGLTIFVLQAGIGKARCDIFRKQIQNNGGLFMGMFDKETTHLVVDEKMESDRMCRIMKIDRPPENVIIVKSLWLSACLKEKTNVDPVPFKLKIETPKPKHSKSPESNNAIVDPLPSTSEASGQDNKPKHQKMDFMYSHKKAAANAVEDSDADSDYVQSGDEDVGIQEQAEQSRSGSAASGSQRKLPVSIHVA